MRAAALIVPAGAAGLALVALALGGCGGSVAAREGGTVRVLYAGSLVGMMENDLGPAFARASGDGYEGFGAGSTEVARQIQGGVRQGDVFVSADPEADRLLEGGAGGGWVRGYRTFAGAPLVLGYDPDSALAGALESQPWYEALARPGVRVGRTDPALDPKGRLTLAAARQAAARLRRPELLAAVESFPVFPEEALVGRLQSGQLDAGFLYRNEALEAGIPTVPLAPARERATYTVALLARAPDPVAARAFVRFLLGPAGRAIMRRHGLTVSAR